MTPNATVKATLEGVLIPAGWGPSGEVLNLSLMTQDETEYRIDPTTAEDHGLYDHLRKRVRLRVVLREKQVLQVIRFEVPGSRDSG